MNSSLSDPSLAPLEVPLGSMLRVPGIRGLFFCRAAAGAPEFYQGDEVLRSLSQHYNFERPESLFEVPSQTQRMLEQVQAGQRPFGVVYPALPGYRYYLCMEGGVEPCSTALVAWAQRRVNADALWTVWLRWLPQTLLIPLLFFGAFFFVMQISSGLRDAQTSDPITRQVLAALAGGSPLWWPILAFFTSACWITVLVGVWLEWRVGAQPVADSERL